MIYCIIYNEYVFLFLGGVDILNIREYTEDLELKILSPYASFSKNTLGRKQYQEKCEIRTEYQRDRDRVIHSKAFRRLKHKTQVFLSPEGDHYRTRLTHTLEVSQIARTIARALRFNEDLTEAISLAHDLGHTPFGHTGEAALNEISPSGFKHFEQSVRVVERLENDLKGLNLTKEVLNGILCHTRGEEAFTIEGRIVKIADRIAYINHDVDDAERAGILNEEDIPSDILKVLGKTRKQRIDKLINSLISFSHDDVLLMDEQIQKAFDDLHSFMYANVYNSDRKTQEKKVPYLVESLYRHFMDNLNELPYDLQVIAKEEDPNRAVCDYIAGMTDKFAVDKFKNIFIPRSWGI